MNLARVFIRYRVAVLIKATYSCGGSYGSRKGVNENAARFKYRAHCEDFFDVHSLKVLLSPAFSGKRWYHGSLCLHRHGMECRPL